MNFAMVVGFRLDGIFLDTLHELQDRFPGRFRPVDTYVIAAMDVFERHCRRVLDRIDESQHDQFQREAPVYAQKCLLLAAQQHAKQ